jgi:hypothetical protein
MTHATADNDGVIDMVSYLRETISKLDRMIAEMQANRIEMASRLAVIEAGTDPELRVAAEDLADRVRKNRPYEDAMSADALVREIQTRIRD